MNRYIVIMSVLVYLSKLVRTDMLTTAAYTTVLDPARLILTACHNKKQDIDPLKLMKLTYISHGWSLALRDTPLFPESVEAWKYGPVIPELYHATKHFGRDTIVIDGLGKGVATENPFDRLIKKVVDMYGEFSGIALSNLTHRRGTPWSNLFDRNRLGIKIENKFIRDHYKSLSDDG